MVFTAEERRERHRLAVQRHRARETPEETSERLRRQRERQQSVRSRFPAGADGESQTIGESRPGWVDGEIPRLRPVSSHAKDDILHELRLALGPSGLEETACAVCDCTKLRKSVHMVPIADADRIQRLRSLLSCAGEDLPVELIAEYDCSIIFENLNGMLLSTRGVRGDGFLQICDDCNSSLLENRIPKFAIKNGFYVGALPTRLANATLPERMMTQIVSIIAVTRVMRGGAHRAIRSHCLAFDSTPGPAIALLPTSIHNITSYRVVLAGPYTTEQEARVRKMHLVRRQVVEDLLAFYRHHNPIYNDVNVDCSNLEAEAVPDHLICKATDANFEADEVDAESERVGGVSELESFGAETDVLERRVVFISEDREVNTGNAPLSHVVELPEGDTSQPQFLVRHSSRFAANDNTLFARMFPHLYPYGRGHPGEKRHVAVSLEACIRHYGMLSSRRFAEDELFMLVSFDFLSVQRMYLQVALKCQRNPSLFEPYSAITEESLMEALRENELGRQGRTTPSHANRSNASNFLKTVELSSGVMWGSDAERAQCRRRAFAYQARFGQPALFVTLTPNVAESYVMAEYCGVLSIDTLFDAAMAEAPGRAALHSASMRNDVASARLFMRNMNAFIEHVLGVAPKRMKTKPFDGLFGEVKAYFGMVETQGGGTLHAHFLVWLVDAPPNSDAFDRAVAEYGDQYYQDIAAYTDSIVTTDLPLKMTDSSCQFCGHSFTDLQELPIPPEAHNNPNKERGRLRGEPVLVRCPGCSTEMSSQHVLRRMLLQHRPPSWPPRLRAYSTEELDTAVRMEVSCRGSIAAAKSAVFRRDMLLTTTDIVDDSHGDHLRSLNAAPFRHEQREDDAFRNDKVARAVAMLPPSVDDERWATHAVAFAVSILVFLLNLHWWSHVGSCFKSSRASSPGQCRYGFPRARVASTSCTSAGVKLARRAPFEYVNGYNATMMLAFKSNHDIQVLIGGLEASLRIYYATKYVTKMQNLIDSVTAVALAAFKRREQRERQVQQPHSDRSSVGRRRVASLIFALTNRREIAGPFAALYLLRGSCAYMSASCTSLPLKDVLRELVEGNTHSCNLVELREGNSDVTFRPASFLDDYLFRPLGLDHKCLYEFTMICFRRKQKQETTVSSSFLAGHPLYSTHCVGYHQTEVIPVITGVRMPYLNSETPRDLVIKRSQCALVLFKPFRNILDLVDDPTNEEAWIQAYLRWEPTRTTFIREIMTNMDDYYRATMQAKEDDPSNDADPENDSDELIGTRIDVDAVLGNDDDTMTPAVGITDDFGHAFNAAGSSADEPTLPIFPTKHSGSMASSVMYQNLLTSTADSTVHAAIDLRNPGPALDIPLEELQQWVKNSQNDEADLQPTEQFADVRPAQVIDLIESALETNNDWSPPSQQTDRPPLSSYARIDEVSKAFTLNWRQHIAFFF